jgi:diguanylate cyclase (GGDEF)-like protein
MNTGDKKEEMSWQRIQDELAEKSGLTVALVEEEGLSNVAVSNNNSICELLTKSEQFIPKCQKFCGKAYQKVTEADKPLKFKCHAGLECVAVPIKTDGDKKFVAITGRTFVKSKDYRTATERAMSGDWKEFPPTRFFENLILTSSMKSLEEFAKQILSLPAEQKEILAKLGSPVKLPEKEKTKQTARPVEDVQKPDNEPNNSKPEKAENKQKIQEIHASVISKNVKKDSVEIIKQEAATNKEIDRQNIEESKELIEWRSIFQSMLNLDYKDACRMVLEFLKERYQISSLAWLENKDNKLEKMLAIGKLAEQEIQISMAINDERFLKLIQKDSSIELKERNKTLNGLESQRIRLFPISVGGEIRSGLVIGEKADDEEIENSIARFCRTIAFELEILRLRDELSRRSWLDIALKKFNDSLKMIDDEEFWPRLMQTTAELLQAERGSILVYEDKQKKLIVKSAIGRKSDFIKKMKSNVGEKIALNVWKRGKPMVVPSIRKTAVEPAPIDWKYKTESFISYPITIGNRKIGVLNLADKVDGTEYKEFDLQLLQTIIPQIAVAIDHAILKNKAGEFEQLSVTDSLTGLLNRRYLEERLSEEITRSHRHGYSMSFMMIDVDDFKSYNDTFLHPEGDKALQIVGQCLRETLRGADIAARYGGEEFSILLPQTTLDEAEIIAERIRTNIETTSFPNRQVTVSIGIASISLEIDTVEKLIESADTALFVAKDKGKNNVQIFETQRKEMLLPN